MRPGSEPGFIIMSGLFNDKKSQLFTAQINTKCPLIEDGHLSERNYFIAFFDNFVHVLHGVDRAHFGACLIP